MIVDFEGEPSRPAGRAARQGLAAARRRRHAALLRLCERDRRARRWRSASAEAAPRVARRRGIVAARRRDRLPRRLRGSRAREPGAGRGRRDARAPAAAASPRQGALRDRLRGGQPAGLDRNADPGRSLDPRAQERPMANDGAEGWTATRRREPASRPLAESSGREARPHRRRTRRCGDRRGRARRPVRGPRSARGRARCSGRCAPCCRRRAPPRSTLDAATAIADGEAARRRLLRRQLRGAVAAELPPAHRDRRPDGDARGHRIASAPVLADEDIAALRDVGSDAVYRKLGAQPATLGGVAGFSFAVWAPERPPGQRRRRLQRLGRPPPPDAAAPRRRRLGAVHSRTRRRARATSSRSRAPTASCCR